MKKPRYQANIGNGALKVSESRIIANMLLEGLTQKQWRQAIENDNILQTTSPQNAHRLSSLIKARLNTMTPEQWQLVRDSGQEVATHAVFAAAIKHSYLLGDFLDQMVRDQFRLFSPTLERKLWPQFIERCHNVDPDMPAWKETTIARLGSTVFTILEEAGYISRGQECVLKPVWIAPEVLEYLRENNEEYVLRCIQVSL